MKTKQKSVRVFEIVTNNFEKLKNFVEKREILLKRFLLVVKTDNEEIKNYLNSKNLEVRFVKADFDGTDEKLEEENKQKVIKEVVKIEKIVKKVQKPKIFDKIIRSGFELITDEKLVFLNRINSGVYIYSSSEIELFDEVAGTIVCDGEYMIVKKAEEGVIIFNKEPLQKIEKLSLILKDGTIKELE